MKPQIFLTLLVLTSGLLLSGCSAPCQHYNRLQVASYVGPELHRKSYGSVTLVFQRPEDIKRPYHIIGMLSCEGSTGEEAGILNAMLYHAADLAGDGILLGGARVGAEKVEAPDADDHALTVNLRETWAFPLTGNRRAYRAQIIKFDN